MEEMITLKVIFVALVCAPLLYLAVVLLGKLCEGVIARSKGTGI
jgi:hypothetical protein